MSKIIHRRPIFIKFELNSIDFMDRLSQKGLTLIAIENNSVVFRVEHKEEIEEIITNWKIIYSIVRDVTNFAT